jgi:hypothetical protein
MIKITKDDNFGLFCFNKIHFPNIDFNTTGLHSLESLQEVSPLKFFMPLKFSHRHLLDLNNLHAI